MKKWLSLAGLCLSTVLLGQNTEKADVSVEKNGGLPVPAGYLTIQDEASSLNQRSILNFAGAGVSCADDAGNSKTTCTIAGGGSTPTGTGFVHVTGGSQDAAARAVDVSTADVTGLLPFANIANGNALTLFGRSANSSGVMAGIAASAASDCVYRESGSTLACGTIATAGIANNAVTLAKLATQAAGTALANYTTSAAVPAAFDPLDNRVIIINDDVLNASSGHIVTVGTGAANTMSVVDAVHPNIYGSKVLATNDVAAILYSPYTSSSRSVRLGSSSWDIRTSVYFSALSNGTDEYDAYFGFINTTAAGEPTEGCYFWYDRNVSTSWQFNCSTVAAGHGTKQVCTGATVTGAGFNDLRITVDEGRTAVHFYTGTANGGAGTECANSPLGATNIPTNATNLEWGWKIEKQAGSGEDDMAVDYFKVLGIASTSR